MMQDPECPTKGEYVCHREDVVGDHQCDFPGVIYEIAKENGIPKEHVIDSYNLLDKPKVGKRTDYMADWSHPNEKGYMAIADLIFKQLSTDASFMEKINKAKAGTDADYNKGIQQLLNQK